VGRLGRTIASCKQTGIYRYFCLLVILTGEWRPGAKALMEDEAETPAKSELQLYSCYRDPIDAITIKLNAQQSCILGMCVYIPRPLEPSGSVWEAPLCVEPGQKLLGHDPQLCGCLFSSSEPLYRRPEAPSSRRVPQL
jgi:hypothetical protein